MTGGGALQDDGWAQQESSVMLRVVAASTPHRLGNVSQILRLRYAPRRMTGWMVRLSQDDGVDGAPRRMTDRDTQDESRQGHGVRTGLLRRILIPVRVQSVFEGIVEQGATIRVMH